MFRRHIDVVNNLVFINELESVTMDVKNRIENVDWYIEEKIEGNFLDWRIMFKKQFRPDNRETEFQIREVCLEILDEAVILWEQERGLKFEPDMYKEYREEIEEIERLAYEKWENELLQSNEEQ